MWELNLRTAPRYHLKSSLSNRAWERKKKEYICSVGGPSSRPRENVRHKYPSTAVRKNGIDKGLILYTPRTTFHPEALTSLPVIFYLVGRRRREPEEEVSASLCVPGTGARDLLRSGSWDWIVSSLSLFSLISRRWKATSFLSIELLTCSFFFWYGDLLLSFAILQNTYRVPVLFPSLQTSFLCLPDRLSVGKWESNWS